jgi:peptidoglycan hydrolase-like protein with peptidoglycan-binding domain
MTQKRTKVLGAVLAFVALAALAGWWGLEHVTSPADVAARTAAPTPSPILVPVEERVLSSNVVTRGTARFGLPQPVSIAPSMLKAQPGLITTLPPKNTALREGGVLLRASGRPVFLLEGRMPAYRDLTPGISGEDVRQLQVALERLGYYSGAPTAVYDPPTGRAVAAWYRGAGFDPFGPTDEQQALVRTMERDAADAEKLHLSSAGAMAAAALGIESARATAEHDERVAASELAAANAERARVVLDPRQPETARAAAESAVRRAEAGVKAARLSGELAVRNALDAQKSAEIDAQLASERADRQAADLKAARLRLGVQLPVDELVFLSALPVRVQEVTAVVGDAARGPVLSVTDNQLAVDSAVPIESAPFVKLGMAVEISEPALGVNARGTVVRVADGPGTNGVDGYHIYFEVRVDRTSTPLQGYSLRLTIPIQSSKQAVIAVPISAVSLASDGTSRLQVQEGGRLEYVIVKPGLSADGFIEVTPIKGTLKRGQLVVVGYESAAPAGTP